MQLFEKIEAMLRDDRPAPRVWADSPEAQKAYEFLNGVAALLCGATLDMVREGRAVTMGDHTTLAVVAALHIAFLPGAHKIRQALLTEVDENRDEWLKDMAELIQESGYDD